MFWLCQTCFLYWIFQCELFHTQKFLNPLSVFCTLKRLFLYDSFFVWRHSQIKPAHDKTYNKICETSKDPDQPVHPPSTARVLVHPSLVSPEAVDGTCDQRSLWSDCAMRRLIRVYGGRTSLIVGFGVRWLSLFLVLRFMLRSTSYSFSSHLNLVLQSMKH